MGGQTIDINAGELERPYEYIDGIQFGWQYITIINSDSDKWDSLNRKQYNYQISVFHLNGKLFSTITDKCKLIKQTMISMDYC